MAFENQQSLRAQELGYPVGSPIGIGKRYSQADLVSFMDAADKVENDRISAKFESNLIAALATPPLIAAKLLEIPQTDFLPFEAVRGISLAVVAGEMGLAGGGLLIEGAKRVNNFIDDQIVRLARRYP